MTFLILYCTISYLYTFGMIYAITRGFHYPMEKMDHFMLLLAPITLPLNLGADYILEKQQQDGSDDFDDGIAPGSV